MIIMIFAMVSDLKTYKIPNQLIITGCFLGLLVNLYEFGIHGLKRWGVGSITPIVILFVLFLFKVLGAGDIKVFSVVGGFLGSTLVIHTILYAFLFGAIMSIFKLIKYRNISYRLHYLAAYISETAKTKTIKNYYDPHKDGYECVIPFTVAIMGGMICSLYLKF